MVRRDPPDEPAGPSARWRGRHAPEQEDGAGITPVDSYRTDGFPVWRDGRSGPLELPPERPFTGWRRGSSREERENPEYDSWLDDPDDVAHLPAGHDSALGDGRAPGDDGAVGHGHEDGAAGAVGRDPGPGTGIERGERSDRRPQSGSDVFPGWRRGTRRSRPEPEEPAADEPAAKPRSRFRPRSLRGAVGLGIAAAILLLYAFLYLDSQARWWLPAAAGFVVLVLLALLRLDRLTRGWTWHVAGLAVLAGLVLETRGNPWSWAVAVSIGVLIAGLLRLPRWPVVAVGAVLCIVSFVGYQFRASEVQQQEARTAEQAGTQMRNAFGYDRPDLVLSKLGDGLTPPDAQAVCRLLDDPAQAQLARATATPDCAAAVVAAAAKVPAGSPTAAPRSTATNAPVPPPGTVVVLDGCATAWGRAVPAVGVVEAVRTDNQAKATWRVAGFRACGSP